MTDGAFRVYAEALLVAGYSPLPVIPGTKKPAMKKWSDFCAQPMTLRAVRNYGTRFPSMGLAVALGYNGLVAIDVDSEHPAHIDAICSALPPAVVAKVGAKGFTAFYRAAPGANIASRHFAASRKAGIADLLSLGTGSVLPPSPHPAGHAYRWLTPQTLLDVPASELPELPADIAVELEKALEPWLPKREFKGVQAVRTTLPEGNELRRLTAFARAGLRRRAEELAATPEGARNNTLFSVAAGLGKYVFHGMLPIAELETAVLAACEANGLLREDGRLSVLATLHKGVARAKDDPLPVLPERR